MTKVTNTAANASNATPANAEKKTKVTLNSLLESGNATLLAAYFIRQGKTVDNVSTFASTMQLVAAEFPAALQLVEKEKAERDADRAAKQAKKDGIMNQVSSEATKLMENAVAALKASLMEMGLSEEDAIKMASQKFGVRKQRQNVKVEVEYNGTRYIVPQIGNVTKVLSEAIQQSGLTRDEFVKKYAVEQPADEDSESESENAETAE